MNANLSGAKAVRDRARLLVTSMSHPPQTRTPSPAGSPPASISGRLSASISADHDGDDGIAGPTASAASRNGPYGRFLELGGVHDAHNPAGWMQWTENGRKYRAKTLDKSGRPYLMPALNNVVWSGTAARIYYDAWLRAQMEIA